MKSFFKSVFTTAAGVLVAMLIALCLLPAIGFVLTRVVQGSGEPIVKKSVLHVKVKGPITEHARALDFDFLSGSPFSADEKALPLFETVSAIEKAKADPRIQGIYLEMRDFQGGWASLTTLHRAIRSFADSGKFVIAYADSLNEKGYYLATAAEQIYLAPAGELEFNGLTVSSPFLKGLLDKLEIEPRVFRVGKFKAAVEPFILNKMSAENREQTQTLLDDIWGSARREYSRFSGASSLDLDKAADNLKIRSANDAKEMGLITDLAYEDQVLDILKKKTVGAEKDLNIVTPMHFWHQYNDSHPPAKTKIAVIFADGEISSGMGSRDSIGSESIVSDIEDAADDEDVKAIVLRINSPGGDALAADIIWREISTTDDTTPVIVSMGDVAASGGYYMAAGARYVLAEPTTITGSIGVFGLMPGTQKFFKDKLGVSFEGVNTHKYSSIGDMNQPLSSVERDFIQKGVERVYDRFLGVVQTGRGFKDRSDVEQIAEGRVWSGIRAKDIGLVDELGGLSLAIEKAAQIGELPQNYSVDIYPKDDDPIMRIAETFLSDSARIRLAQYTWFKKLERYSQDFTVRAGAYARMPFDLDIH